MPLGRACIHFAGPASCKLGLDVEALRDDDLRLPCQEFVLLSLKAPQPSPYHVGSMPVSGEKPCEKREWPKPTPAPTPGRMTARLDAIADGKCPTCREPMRGEVEVNGVVYAMPCRHVLRGEGADR